MVVIYESTRKKIILDPGHGGKFPGTVEGGSIEKNIVLQVSQRIRTKLVNEGALVYMTRTTDKDFGGTTAGTDINNRVAYINNNIPASHALVSIHVNAIGGRIGSFYQQNATASKTFAETIQRACTPWFDVFGCYSADFAILRDTTKASAKSLIEIGVIDDYELNAAWKQERIASAIVDGIRNYLS
ncbi:N-acetylmuramoyl-L-alanine amidase family protein [Paenibacillus sp. NPDC093718]|uniref:N-acetylmuramoyl-L-alanine amidase family protein n=1 Tax=Paenibacillus sp. NPDC093718 TaxID=3390601 RepID=UPI003D02129D